MSYSAPRIPNACADRLACLSVINEIAFLRLTDRGGVRRSTHPLILKAAAHRDPPYRRLWRLPRCIAAGSAPTARARVSLAQGDQLRRDAVNSRLLDAYLWHGLLGILGRASDGLLFGEGERGRGGRAAPCQHRQEHADDDRLARAREPSSLSCHLNGYAHANSSLRPDSNPDMGESRQSPRLATSGLARRCRLAAAWAMELTLD